MDQMKCVFFSWILVGIVDSSWINPTHGWQHKGGQLLGQLLVYLFMFLPNIHNKQLLINHQGVIWDAFDPLSTHMFSLRG